MGERPTFKEFLEQIKKSKYYMDYEYDIDGLYKINLDVVFKKTSEYMQLLFFNQKINGFKFSDDGYIYETLVRSKMNVDIIATAEKYRLEAIEYNNLQKDQNNPNPFDKYYILDCKISLGTIEESIEKYINFAKDLGMIKKIQGVKL